MHPAPVGSHLLAVLAAGIEVGDLIGAEDIVHILGQFGLQRAHHGKLLAHEDLGEQFVRTSEDHRLLVEILNESTLAKELWHIAHLMTGFAGKNLAGARKNGGADKHRDIGQVLDQFLHKRKILRAIVLSRHMNLQECDVNLAQVIKIALRRVTDEQFTLRIVMLQPILQGSSNEATSDNSNVDHLNLG